MNEMTIQMEDGNTLIFDEIKNFLKDSLPSEEAELLATKFQFCTQEFGNITSHYFLLNITFANCIWFTHQI